MKFNYTKLMFLNYIYIVILEMLFKIFIMDSIDFGCLYILIFSIPFAFIFTFIGSLFWNKKVNRVISIILWIVLFFVFSAEAVYNSFYKTIFGIGGLEYGGQVMEFFDTIVDHVLANWLLILLSFIPLVGLVFLSVNKKIQHEKYYGKESIVLFVASIFTCITVLQINYNNFYVKKLFLKTNDIYESTNYMGLLSGVTLDGYKTITGFEENVEIEIVDLPLDEEKTTTTVIRQDTEEVIYDDKVEYNITNIDFDKLINSTNDDTVKTMHKYFKSQSATNKNEYTGMFAGKNLIFITAEGFYPIAVNEKYTPTLYKLANNGFVFNNFYQPIFNCSTSDGEFINMLSILPGVKTCSMKATPGVYLPYNLGMIMKNYNYKTYAFHGWTYTYYNRDETYPNMGYTYYGYDRFNTKYKYALKNIKYSWPTSDIDVANSSYPIFKDDENYVAYYMSISGHLRYNFTGGNAIASKNKKLVSDLKANENVKAYIATQIEFDRSLKVLLDNLEQDGKLDNTVIAIVADHYPYGLTDDEIKGYDPSVKNNTFDLYKNTFILYNSEIKEPIVVDKYSSSLDVLPTLLNMFGVEFDSRLLMGRDIFSSEKDLVIFNNKSWITDKGRYFYSKKKFESFTGEEVSQEYIDKINNIVKLKFQMSKLLISKDYYRKVLGK